MKKGKPESLEESFFELKKALLILKYEFLLQFMKSMRWLYRLIRSKDYEECMEYMTTRIKQLETAEYGKDKI